MSKSKLLLCGVLALAVLAVATPARADAAAYRHYVACGLSKKAKPSHVCPREAKKGAFFRSTRRNARYTVCMRLPSRRSICARAQVAEQGILYVNKITSAVPGKHRITWFVKGKRVGAFVFRVKA